MQKRVLTKLLLLLLLLTARIATGTYPNFFMAWFDWDYSTRMGFYVHNRLLASPPPPSHPQAFIPVSMTLYRYKFLLLGGKRGIVGVKYFTDRGR